ncbi:MAG: hypothetical protein EG822_17390 [Deltaproteobacteria bacterium]|nr:hypothetical protein [Deltaproteobacteria bacterium]TLN03283.1 MAG: hypothetical protein FDZ73_08295 [bacterium]
MNIIVKASDLKYKYPRDTTNRELPKFTGKPDPEPFNRDDLYDILPMLSAAMTALETDDGQILHLLEDIINTELPRCVETREEVFDFLTETVREALGGR